jgi:hypothetical protein
MKSLDLKTQGSRWNKNLWPSQGEDQRRDHKADSFRPTSQRVLEWRMVVAIGIMEAII